MSGESTKDADGRADAQRNLKRRPREAELTEARLAASDAAGYDFFCYDRVEIERTKEFKEHKAQIWGLPV